MNGSDHPGGDPAGERPGTGRPGSPPWRAAERLRLARFAAGSFTEAGTFAYLDDAGRPTAGEPFHLWIHCRMTHIFGLEALHGTLPEARQLATAGIRGLVERFEDPVNGGWFDSLDPTTCAPLDTGKSCYSHAFVVLAASTGVAAGIPGAAELLERARDVMLRRFWDEAAGRCSEHYAGADWTEPEAYRGANANMHTVEAFLTTAAATGESDWARRALRIAEPLMNVEARRLSWRVAEHFDEEWRLLREYNTDDREHHFRPYGLTIGHWLEWARLLVALDVALPDAPAWLLEGATALFENSASVGWPTPDAIGCPYTVDFEDRTVVDARLFWPIAEAVLTADALTRRTGHAGAAALYERWWADIDRWFLDRTGGSWHSELDAAGRPATTVWTGKPDTYHAYQASLFPDLPLGLGRRG
jgi:sulfoquinovose isomerase